MPFGALSDDLCGALCYGKKLFLRYFLMNIGRETLLKSPVAIFSCIAFYGFFIQLPESAVKAQEETPEVMRQGGVFMMKGHGIQETQLNIAFRGYRSAPFIFPEQQSPDGTDETPFT